MVQSLKKALFKRRDYTVRFCRSRSLHMGHTYFFCRLVQVANRAPFAQGKQRKRNIFSNVRSRCVEHKKKNDGKAEELDVKLWVRRELRIAAKMWNVFKLSLNYANTWNLVCSYSSSAATTMIITMTRTTTMITIIILFSLQTRDFIFTIEAPFTRLNEWMSVWCCERVSVFVGWMMF